MISGRFRVDPSENYMATEWHACLLFGLLGSYCITAKP